MPERFASAREFARIGRELFLAGLNNTHSGNLSVRDGDDLVITKTGTMLGAITPDRLVRVPIFDASPDDRLASVELPTHRAIYQATGALAVVHAHPQTLIALSLRNDRIVPVDEEGKYYTPEGIPVVSAAKAIGSVEMAAILARALAIAPGVVLRGHGMFAIGPTLESGAKLISSAEHSAGILLRLVTLARAGCQSPPDFG